MTSNAVEDSRIDPIVGAILSGNKSVKVESQDVLLAAANTDAAMEARKGM